MNNFVSHTLFSGALLAKLTPPLESASSNSIWNSILLNICEKHLGQSDLPFLFIQTNLVSNIADSMDQDASHTKKSRTFGVSIFEMPSFNKKTCPVRTHTRTIQPLQSSLWNCTNNVVLN